MPTKEETINTLKDFDRCSICGEYKKSYFRVVGFNGIVINSECIDCAEDNEVDNITINLTKRASLEWPKSD